jgi:hypothetical protein
LYYPRPLYDPVGEIFEDLGLSVVSEPSKSIAWSVIDLFVSAPTMAALGLAVWSHDYEIYLKHEMFMSVLGFAKRISQAITILPGFDGRQACFSQFADSSGAQYGDVMTKLNFIFYGDLGGSLWTSFKWSLVDISIDRADEQSLR